MTGQTDQTDLLGGFVPPTAEQAYAALTALGVPVVVDPELRPDGLHDGDRPVVLGALLAAVERALAAEPADTTAEVSASYRQLLGADRDGGTALVVALMRRFGLLRTTVEAVFGTGDPVGGGVVATAGAAAGMLQLLLFTGCSPQTPGSAADPDGAQLLARVAGEADADFQAGRRAFEAVRRDLSARGYQL